MKLHFAAEIVASATTAEKIHGVSEIAFGVNTFTLLVKGQLRFDGQQLKKAATGIVSCEQFA